MGLPEGEEMAPDWSKLPPGTKFADVDDMPIVVLPTGLCLSGWTGADISFSRVAKDGSPLTRDEFDRMVASAKS
jgi:hypothetical protein